MNDRKPPRKVIALLAGLVLLIVIAATLSWLRLHVDPSAAKTIPISQALDLADRHEIAEVLIAGNTVQLTDRQGIRYTTVKEDGYPAVDVFRRSGATVTVVSVQPSPWPAIGFAAILVAALGALLFLGSRTGANSHLFSFGRSRARRWSGTMPTVTFADVAGVDEAKQELEEIVQFLKNPEKFRSLGARIPRGLLLAGPPGAGKTLLSKAVAGEAGVPFFSISGSEFVEMFVGVGAARVRDLFAKAKRHAPSIVFIDEIDAVGRHRSSHPAGANEERDQTLNQLLVEMDGFDSNASTIVIAATNRPDILDPALLRPGRFDRQVMIDVPDVRGREAILRIHARGKPLAADVDLASLARQTPGFSGADLANLINEAALLAARRDHTTITMADLEESILRVMAGPAKKSRLLSEEERRIIAFHEVGHALVMKFMPHADPVHKISIISRGRALGLTIQQPKEDRYLLTAGHLKARLAAAMGGRVAEELVFGDFTTGAAQDLDYASTIARRMVTELGMSRLGNIHLGRREAPEQLSEAMAARVDAEVCRLLDEASETAKRILTERQRALHHIAEHLIRVETIDGEELDRLLAECSGPADRLLESIDLPAEPAPSPAAPPPADATNLTRPRA